MKLDEQSFQSLLSAAFIIQEHNARNLAPGAMVVEDETPELLGYVSNFPTSLEEGDGRQTDGKPEGQLSQILEQHYPTPVGQLAVEIPHPEISQPRLQDFVRQALQATHADALRSRSSSRAG